MVIYHGRIVKKSPKKLIQESWLEVENLDASKMIVSFHCLGNFSTDPWLWENGFLWFWLGYSGIFNSCNSAGFNWQNQLFLTQIAGSEKINTQTHEFDLDVVWAILHFIIYPYELRFLSLRITQRCFPNHQRWKATQQCWTLSHIDSIQHQNRWLWQGGPLLVINGVITPLNGLKNG